MKPVEKSSGGSQGPRKGKGQSCPVCGKQASVDDFLPFCSGRCADVDLSRWLGDVYVIEGSSLAPQMADDDESRDR